MPKRPDPNYWNNLRAKSLKKHPLKRTPLKKSGKPIRKRSVKRAKQENKYNREIKTWKEQNPYCKARLEGCTVYTVDNHHPRGKEGDLLNDPTNRLPVCRNCHDKITKMPIEQAIALGLSERRNTADRGKKIY